MCAGKAADGSWLVGFISLSFLFLAGLLASKIVGNEPAQMIMGRVALVTTVMVLFHIAIAIVMFDNNAPVFMTIYPRVPFDNISSRCSL